MTATGIRARDVVGWPVPSLSRLAVVAALIALAACNPAPTGPLHRERSTARDPECRDPAHPHAYFYPAQNRDYGPDDPKADGCDLLVPDHLFCCPKGPRPTDR